MLRSAQKGFAPILIILLTALTIGATTFLVFVSNPNLFKNPPEQIQTTSNKKVAVPSQYPTPASSNSTPQKSAFQLLKDKILPPTASPTSSTTQQGDTASPQPVSTSKPDNNPNPSTSSSPNPAQPTPIPVQSYSQLDPMKKFP